MSDKQVRRAVVLAAGRGLRMRRGDESADASAEQHQMADRGLKALMPMNGRPFLDYQLRALLLIGIERICLVVGQGRQALRDHYERSEGELSVEFAVQTQALGTADALLSAESFTAGESFLLLNSDNYYPSAALSRLAQVPDQALLGLDCRAVLHRGASNLSRERLEKYALLDVDTGGRLTRIIEKPGPSLWSATSDSTGDALLVSVNALKLDGRIMAACRSISPSSRGELELPAAVQYALDHLGQTFRVVSCDEPVLDLSTRSDIRLVERKLEGLATW